MWTALNMATSNNQLQAQQKPKFSVAITTKGYQSLISNTLRDPARARRFTASITSAVAVNPAFSLFCPPQCSWVLCWL